MPTITNSTYIGRVASAIVLIVLPLISLADALASTSTISEEAYYQIEENVFQRAQIDDALTKVNRAHEANPNDPWVYMAASLAVLVSGYKIGDWYSLETFTEGTVDKALELASKAREIGPQNSQSHAHFARLLIVKGDYQKAWNLLNEAHKLNPNNFYPWYFRGIISEKMRDTARARDYFNEAENRIARKHHVSLINIHRQKVAKLARDTNEQERLLKDNIAQNPNKPHYYGNYAKFLVEQKRYDEAIEYWKKAIKLGSYPHAVKQLEKTKQLKQSEEYYTQ